MYQNCDVLVQEAPPPKRQGVPWAGAVRVVTSEAGCNFTCVPFRDATGKKVTLPVTGSQLHKIRTLRLELNSHGRKDLRVNGRQALKLDNQINPALTAPIVNRPVKLPPADLTRYTDRALGNQRECLVPARLQRAARDSGDWLEPSQGKRACFA